MRISSGRTRAALLAVAVIPAFGLAACSADQTDLQNKIKNGLNGPLAADAHSSGLQTAQSVSCPSNVQLKQGTMFDCTVTGTDVSGKSATFSFHGQIGKGNTIEPLSLKETGGSSGSPSTPATTTT